MYSSKSELHSLIRYFFPELASFLGAPAAKHKTYIYAVLREFPSANKLANANLTKLTNLISNHSQGRLGKEQALALKKLASHFIGHASPALEFELLQTIDTIEYFTTMRESADKEVEKMKRYLDKKRSEGKHLNVVISHVVKKLVRIIFQLLKNGDLYDEEKMIVN